MSDGLRAGNPGWFRIGLSLNTGAWGEVVTATQEPDGQSVVSIRRWRAIALISLATIVSVAASVGYLHLTLRPTAKRASPGISPQELGTTDFVTYDFISPSVGWALDFPTTGFSPTSPITSPLPIVSQSPGGGRFVVFRTVDGARNWKKQLTGQTSFGGFSPNSMHFLDKAHGFIAISGPTDQLYRTTDGGAHWVQLPLPSLQIGAITFSDASNGWLSSFASASSPVSRLFATHDAGDSWQRLPDSPIRAGGLAVRRTSEAWLGSFGPGPPRVYRSSDGGQSWQPRDIPYPPGLSPDGAYQWGASVSLLPGVGVIASVTCTCASIGSHDLTSFDSGTTWRFVPPAPGVVAYQDAFHWWAFTSTVLFKSLDSGQTWTQVTDKLPDLAFVPRVLDSKHAWAQVTVVGGYGLVFTADGGLHWTRATVPHAS